MKFRRLLTTAIRWLLRVVGVVAVLLVVGYIALHWAVRSALQSALDGAGLGNATFHVREVRPWRVTVGGVSVPDASGDGPRLAEATAEFTLREILSGKVRSLRIGGASLTVDVSDGTPRVVGMTLPATTRPAAATSPSVPNTNLLPGRVELYASVVRVRLGEGRELSMPVEGKFRRSADGRAALSIKLSPGTDGVTVDASLDSDGRIVAYAEGAVSSGLVIPLLPPGTMPPTATLNARGRVVGTYDSANGVITGRIEVEGARAAYATEADTLLLHDTSVMLMVWRDRSGSVRVDAQIAGVAEAAVLGGATSFTAQARLDDEGFVTGAASVMGPGVTANVPTFSGHLASGSPSGRANVELSARVPPAVIAALRDAGVVFERPGPVLAKGVVTLAPVGGSGGGLIFADLNDVSLAAGAVHVPSQSVSLTGPVVRLGTVTASGSLGKDWTLTARDLSADATVAAVPGGAQIVPGTQPASTTRPAPARVSAAIPFLAATLRNGTPELFAREIVARLSPTDVRLPGVRVGGAEAELRLSGRLAGGAVEVRLLEGDRGSHVSVASLAPPPTAGGEPEWSVGPTRVALRPSTQPTTRQAREGLPLVAVRPDGPAEVAVRYSADDVPLVAYGAEARVGSLLGSLHTVLSATPTLDGEVRAERTSVRHAASGVVLGDMTLSLPVNLDAVTPREGRLYVGTVVRDGETLPGDLRGTLFVTRQRLWADLTWPLLSEGAVKASADVWLLGDRTAGVLKAWVPRFEFTRAGELKKLLPPVVADADVTGTFEADVGLSFSAAGDVQRWGIVTVADGSLRSKALDAELTGLSGVVSLRTFAPPESHPMQTLTVKSARLAKAVISDGKLDFRLDPGGIVFVEQARFSFAGGSVSAAGFRVQPGRQAVELTLYADKLDLGSLARLASDGRVSGTGRLYARLPVSVRWPESIVLGSGYVYAEGGDGSVSLGLTAADVGKLLGGGGEEENLVRQRVTAALTSFDYSALSLDLIRDEKATDAARALTASLRFAGKGPSSDRRGADAQALDLTFNFTGLEDLVSAFLLVKRGK